MILSEQDSGHTIDIEVNKIVTIRLKENPTTAYLWTVERDRGLEYYGERFEPGGAIGGGGIRVFQFRTTQIGSYELRMKNWREWEGEGSIINRFYIRFIVK